MPAHSGATVLDNPVLDKYGGTQLPHTDPGLTLCPRDEGRQRHPARVARTTRPGSAAQLAHLVPVSGAGVVRLPATGQAAASAARLRPAPLASYSAASARLKSASDDS